MSNDNQTMVVGALRRLVQRCLETGMDPNAEPALMNGVVVLQAVEGDGEAPRPSTNGRG